MGDEATAVHYPAGRRTAGFLAALAFFGFVVARAVQGRAWVGVGLFVAIDAVIAYAWWWSVAHPAELRVDHDSITLYRGGQPATGSPVLSRAGGDFLRFVVKQIRTPRGGKQGWFCLQIDGTEPLLSVRSFRVADVRAACEAQGWSFVNRGEGPTATGGSLYWHPHDAKGWLVLGTLFVVALFAPVALVVQGIIVDDGGLLVAGVVLIVAIFALFAYRQRQARHPAGLDVTPP